MDKREKEYSEFKNKKTRTRKEYYRENIMGFMTVFEWEGYIDWLETHDETEQVAILKEELLLIKERSICGVVNGEEFNNAIEKYENNIARREEILACKEKIKQNIAEIDRVCLEVFEDVSFRNEMIISIVTKNQDEKMMRKWADDIMQAQKRAGIFDAKYWMQYFNRI